MTLLAAAVAAQVFAAVSAVMLARRRPAHLPAAVALVLFAAQSLVHAPILAALRPLPRPVEGAARVLGLDLSEKMLAQAQALGADAAITYERADLETFDLPPAAFAESELATVGEALARTGNNIQNVAVTHTGALDIKDVVGYTRLVLTAAANDALIARFAATEKKSA